MTKKEWIVQLAMAGKQTAEIARDVGWNPRSVSRLLSNFRKSGELRSARKYITSCVTDSTYSFMVAEAAKRKVKPAELQAMVAEAIAGDAHASSLLRNVLDEG